MQALYKKLFFMILLCLGLAARAVADEKVTFEVNAPMIVSSGEAFRVEFALNAKPDSDSFVPPSFPEFDVLAGPAVSQGQSIQIINGQTSRSVNYTITYVLLPNREGEFRIGSAAIEVGGRQYRTRETIVEVRAGSSSSSQQSQSSSRESSESDRKADGQISKDDLMLRLVVSRTDVYKGEPIRASLKLYSRVNIAGSESSKMPTFNGFWSQELTTEQGPYRETFKGKVYETYNIAEYLLFPQQSGVLHIEPAHLTVVAQVIVQSNRGFDPFFGGGHEVYNVRRELVTPPVSVSVKEFPKGAPASFGGAVGKFTMTSELSSSSISANSAANVIVKISGTGNIGFISAPKFNVPSSFELYDVKSTEQIKNSASGGSGQRVFEYPFIARAEGEYTLTPILFSYFNPETNSYIELSSEEFRLRVLPDLHAPVQQQGIQIGIRKEDVNVIGTDVRILLGNTSFTAVVAPFVFSGVYWLILSALILLAVILYFCLRRRIRLNSNTALVKGRRANKVAVQRFRSAARYMKEQNSRAFYEEMLKAVWGYLGDKFNIPTSNLTKESVREELHRRGADQEAEMVVSIISSCEEAQYSPLASKNMQEVYAEGIDVLSKMESAVKK